MPMDDRFRGLIASASLKRGYDRGWIVPVPDSEACASASLIPRLDCLGLIEAVPVRPDLGPSGSDNRFRGLIASASLKQQIKRRFRGLIASASLIACS